MERNPPVTEKSCSVQSLHSRRPLSPHLSVYKLQLTSGLSILHRITGAYLYFGLVMLAWAIFYLVYFPYILTDMHTCINSNVFTAFLFKAALFAWAFSLLYHQLNGIRHLFWDIGKGFDLEVAYISGRFVLGLSILLTIICWTLI